MAEFVGSVGMEVHAELLTESKMFCRCPVAFGGEPNTRVCPICLGLPGTLPVPNHAAIELVIRTALALNCTIARKSIFHRKNYFYPDLPKGFQVSQYGETNPLGYKGYLDVPTKDGGTKRIHIRRVHLEEDTGKLMHLPSGGSGVDYNRAGVPLMEIVTDFPPDIEDPEVAGEYLRQLRAILVWIGVCDGKMEEGSLRCEPNISVRVVGSDQYGNKTELKNLNSFRAVQLGTAYEFRRQIAVIEGGGTVLQETRGWNEGSETSFAMRIKEAENDYRYFPCPDLAPMEFSDADVDRLQATLPELPLAKWTRYRNAYGLSERHADQLISSREWAEYFEEAVAGGGDPQLVANWMMSDFSAALNEQGITARQSLVQPLHLVELTKLIQAGTINGKIGKEVFAEVFETGKSPEALVKAKGLEQVSDDGAIRDACRAVVEANAEIVAKYRSGQTSVKGFLVGAVMKQGAGRFNPQLVQQLMSEVLDA